MAKAEDLTGKRFGRLTVISRAENRKDGKARWKCLCDCGKETIVYAYSLKRGNTKSCGCIRSEDLTGKRFGHLTVIGKAEPYITPKGVECIQWLCRCDCGNERKVVSNHLLSGRTDNCGCKTGERISESNIIDLTGQRFGKLTVLKRIENKKYKDRERIQWLCKCDCGNTTKATTPSLRSGNKSSCGCLGRSDIIGKRFGKLTVVEYCGMKGDQSLWKCLCDCGNERICQIQYLRTSKNHSCGCVNPLEKHGMSRSKIYHVWNGMKERCGNPNDKNYHNYGGRGITVCDEWLGEHGFENFYKWAVEAGYDESKSRAEQSIDRINVNGNYEPNNCRWATQKEQANNERRNIRITYKGKTQTAKQWSEELGINYRTMRSRIKSGLSTEDILSK